MFDKCMYVCVCVTQRKINFRFTNRRNPYFQLLCNVSSPCALVELRKIGKCDVINILEFRSYVICIPNTLPHTHTQKIVCYYCYCCVMYFYIYMLCMVTFCVRVQFFGSAEELLLLRDGCALAT